jgi:hypothetical protein
MLYLIMQAINEMYGIVNRINVMTIGLQLIYQLTEFINVILHGPYLLNLI